MRSRPNEPTTETDAAARHPWAAWLERTHAHLDDAVPRCREPEAFGKLVQLGWRRTDLVDALEQLSVDRNVPSGSLATLSATKDITRGRAFLTRVQLGVGALGLAHVRAVGRRVGDDATVDVAMASIEPDVHALVGRLIRRLRAIDGTSPQPTDFFVRTILLTALDRALARERDPRLHDEVADALADWALASGLVPGAARTGLPAASLATMLGRVGSLDSARWSRRFEALFPLRTLHEPAPVWSWSGRRSLRGDSYRQPVEPRPKRHAPRSSVTGDEALSRYHALDALLRPCGARAVDTILDLGWIYDTSLAAMPSLGARDGRATLLWPRAAQITWLDAVADAGDRGIAPAAPTFVDFLEDLARGRSGAASAVIRSGTAKWRSLFGHGRRSGPRFDGDALTNATTRALAAHAPDRWASWLEELASSIDPAGRLRAAALIAGSSPGGHRVDAVLSALELDPDGSVRSTAKAVRRDARRALDERHVARVLLWAARVDDDTVYARVERHARIAPSILSDAVARRLRRHAMRDALSDDARAFLFAAAPLREDTRVGVCVVFPARFFASDGYRIDTAISIERTEIATTDLGVVVPDADFSRFVAAAPSSFMRMSIEGVPDLAVRVVRRGGAQRIEAADPALLSLLV